MLTQILKSPYIYNYFTKPPNFDEIVRCLNNIVKERNCQEKEHTILKKIDIELNHLHFNFSYNGTKYLKECIYELYIKNELDFENLSKNIYPIIAKKHHKSANNIHTNIKQSVQSMCCDCDENTINSYFNNTFFVKPTVKEIIFTILNKL